MLVPVIVIGAGKSTAAFEVGITSPKKLVTSPDVFGSRLTQLNPLTPMAAVAEVYMPCGTLTVKSGSVVPLTCMNSACRGAAIKLTVFPDWLVNVTEFKTISNSDSSLFAVLVAKTVTTVLPLMVEPVPSPPPPAQPEVKTAASAAARATRLREFRREERTRSESISLLFKTALGNAM